MKLPAAAYSAFVATSATKAGSYGVFGEGEIDEIVPLMAVKQEGIPVVGRKYCYFRGFSICGS
jgi:hypothetical protein